MLLQTIYETEHKELINSRIWTYIDRPMCLDYLSSASGPPDICT